MTSAWWRSTPSSEKPTFIPRGRGGPAPGPASFDLVDKRENNDSRLFNAPGRLGTPIPMDGITVLARMREGGEQGPTRVITVGTVDWCIGEPTAYAAAGER